VGSAPLAAWLKDWAKARDLLRRPKACWRAWRLQHSIDSLRPREENRLYLKLLAVDPPAQGLGAGALLLEAVAARARETRAPIHLETFRRENVDYYKAKGFVLLAEIIPHRMPHFWQMRRKPA
jgi:GNAT superfamily N-acetyltransferase